MAGDIGESVADMATGGLAARALEPRAEGAKAAGATPGSAPGPGGHTREEACLNCGTRLVGSHCHACGQRAHVHRTLSAFVHDLVHGVLHFEGKTWRTLPLLAWRPGRLTREYIDGRRASYVSPIALFLFVVFLSYATFSLLGGGSALGTEVTGMERVREVHAANAERLAELEEERAAVPDEGERAAEIDTRIAALEDDQAGLELVLGEPGNDFATRFASGFERTPLPSGSAVAKAWEKASANPQLTIYKLQTNAYKFSWMLIPLSVPFVWLLFPFSRRFRGYDHTVFATYSITFMIALAAVSSLLFFFGYPSIGGLVLLYAPWHMYRQLREAYGLGRFGAFWRMLALSLFAWIAISLFVTGIAMMAGG